MHRETTTIAHEYRIYWHHDPSPERGKVSGIVAPPGKSPLKPPRCSREEKHKVHY
jgi:hypothetical protein